MSANQPNPSPKQKPSAQFPSRYDPDNPAIPAQAGGSGGVQPPAPTHDPLIGAYGGNYGPPGSGHRRRRRRWNPYLVGCGVLGLFVISAFLCSGTLITISVWNTFNDLLTERIAKILPETNNVFQTTRIFDRYGGELYQLIEEGRRTKVKLSDINQYVIDATIAVEDDSFYENPGVDLASIARAGLGYFTGNESGGASTITQQLIRNIAFEYEYRTERSARRKLEEILLALVLTQQKSKDEILEMYLNLIYYGNLAYGIEAASQTYFGKSSRDLTIAEAALLAGLPQSPSTLDPFNPDPVVQDAVLARRKVVLDLMLSRGKITRADYDQARVQPLVFADPNVSLKSPHFTLFAQAELKNLLPAINLPAAYMNTGGLSVYTTLDPTAQSLAERVAKAQIDTIKAQHNANNAAVIVLKPGTGEILALMGSVDYRDEAIDGRVNMAVAPRQPGSAMKPLTYAAAMERGFSAATVLWDVETHIDIPGSERYSPVNYDRQFHGPVRVRDALARSYNIPAVLTLRQIGVDSLLAFAERLGVRSLGRDVSRYGLSLTLGGGELTPLELAQAYAVFANDGQLVNATSILCVVNNEGQIIYQYEEGCAGRGTLSDKAITTRAAPIPVLDPRIAFVISDILSDNRARSAAMGANSPLRTDGIITSVKTGTTNDYRDNWTVGYTKNVVVGVWVGNADNTPMQGTTGLTGAAPIWNEVMRGIYANDTIRAALQINGGMRSDELIPPGGMSNRQICDLGAVTDPSMECQPGRNEWILETPPMVPGESGGLTGQGIPQFASTPSPANGPYLEDIDPGVTRALVRPVDPNLALVMSPGGVPVGGTAYCLVPNEVRAQTPGAQMQVFIKATPFEDQDPYVRLYAASRTLAVLPRIVCSADMLMSNIGVSGISAFITSPMPGESVSGTVYVSGGASWAPGAAAFFKMEIQGPQFPNWTTFAGPFNIPVISGALGDFGSTGLMPGVYQIRVVVVGNDYNHAMESVPVPINVTGQ